MKVEMNFKVAPTMTAPTAAITRIEPKLVTDCNKCEGNINIGMFFDGTNNNRDADRQKLKHTNVVRLFDAYRDQPEKGYFAGYIPGVGTPFPDIREEGGSSLGSGFGIGCEQRVLYALLYVFNAIHSSAFDGAKIFWMETNWLPCVATALSNGRRTTRTAWPWAGWDYSTD